MNRLVFFSMLFLLSLVVGCASSKQTASTQSQPSTGGEIFAESAQASGIDFVHFNGISGEFYFPEIMGAGSVLFDFDNDGDLDAYLVQGLMLGVGKTISDATVKPQGALQGRLYRNDLNNGQLRFTDVTAQSGIVARLYGMGATTGDFDNDGWLDVLAVNGAVTVIEAQAAAKDPFPFHQSNQLYRNKGDSTFVEVTAQAGAAFKLSEVGRGAAFGDVDNDVLVANNNGRARLLLNQVGNRQHWLGLKLVEAKSGRDALGARVTLVRNRKPALLRRARADGSYASANDPRVLFGLGDSTETGAVRVTWPNGKTEEWANLLADKYTTLREGSGKGGV